MTIVDSLAEHATLERYAAGRTLFREGDFPRGVYIVYNGKVDLIFSGKKGATKALQAAEDGQILGLSCVLSHRCLSHKYLKMFVCHDLHNS